MGRHIDKFLAVIFSLTAVAVAIMVVFLMWPLTVLILVVGLSATVLARLRTG